MNDDIQAAVNSGKISDFVASRIANGDFTLQFALAKDSGRLISVVIAFAIFECFFVALFYYSRLKFRSKRDLDLWLMIPTFLVCFANLVICIIYVQKGGIGRHVQVNSWEKIQTFLKLTVAISFLNPAAVALPRLCIICLYLRIFSGKAFRYATYGIAGLIIATLLAEYIVQFRMCIPFSKQWNPLAEGTCLNQFKVYIWFCLPIILTDLMMIILPLPFIWRLQTSRAQKIGLTVTFLAGGIGTITSIVRISIFFKKFTTYDLDFTWVGVDIVLWSTVEAGVYLIAACLPSLRPLLNTFLKDFDSNKFRHGIEKFKLPHSRKPGSRDHLPSRAITIPLADPTTGRGRFNRINEQHSRDVWPEDFLGTKPGLATCTRESFDDSQNGSGDLGMRHNRTSEFMGGIVVHKEYTIKTEPIVYDDGREYVVSR